MVSGPGLIHALGGMANANMNCWYDSINKLMLICLCFVYLFIYFFTIDIILTIASVDPTHMVKKVYVACAQACGCYWRVLRSKPGDSRGLSGVSSGKACLHVDFCLLTPH